jgi:hypothetical protein
MLARFVSGNAKVMGMLPSMTAPPHDETQHSHRPMLFAPPPYKPDQELIEAIRLDRGGISPAYARL